MKILLLKSAPRQAGCEHAALRDYAKRVMPQAGNHACHACNMVFSVTELKALDQPDPKLANKPRDESERMERKAAESVSGKA